MEIQELNNLYEKLLKDKNFDILRSDLKEPNIFEILRISKKEIRHSNFLSWLLDPKGNHGLNDQFLNRFLSEVSLYSNNKLENHIFDMKNIEIRREWKFIDLLIIFENEVICIENKIFSSEHSDQLIRYKKLIESEFPDKKKFFVYLTPFGIPSEQETEVYIPISYQSVINSSEDIYKINFDNMNLSVKNYINDYITTLKRDVMGNDKLTELSNEIYSKHKEIFDFVYDRKPQTSSKIYTLFKDVLISEGYLLGSESPVYLRFTTDNINKLTYYNTRTKNGWKMRESFLFEFVLSPNNNKIRFKSVISPSDPNYDVNRLSEIIMEIDGSVIPKGKKWLSNHSVIFDFDFDLLYEKDDEEIKTDLKEIVGDIKNIIDKYEDKFLEYKDELKKMKTNS